MVIFLGSCSPQESLLESEPTLTIEAPTPTEAPMAARVNGEGILLTDYEAEYQRYQDALVMMDKEEDAEQIKENVLNEMINQSLLVQGAREAGYDPAEADVQAKYDELATELGGEDALRSWMFENHFDDQSFRHRLTEELAAIWMRNQIISSVPLNATQVHARQILVTNETLAISIERQLQVGTDFETLARQNDPLTAGELGWFPRGYLLQPEVENAAFALNPGEYSAIIRTSYGYHIVFVIEKDEQYPLSPDALTFVRKNVLRDWLETRREQSTIEIILP